MISYVAQIMLHIITGEVTKSLRLRRLAKRLEDVKSDDSLSEMERVNKVANIRHLIEETRSKGIIL